MKGRFELRSAKLVACVFKHKTRPSVVGQGSVPI